MPYCVICNKEAKGWTAQKVKTPQGDEMWVCGIKCGAKFQRESKAWGPEKWAELREQR